LKTVDDAEAQGRLLDEGPTSHEANRLRVRGLAWFAAALVGVTVMVQLLLVVVMHGFSREEKQLETLALPRFAGDTGEYPAPRVQADPGTELKKMKAEDLGRLNTYGWVDRKARVAHIPIERAIEIVAEKGLRAPETRGATSGKPAENSGPAERNEQPKPGARGEPWR
jgi:hypothetical protein